MSDDPILMRVGGGPLPSRVSIGRLGGRSHWSRIEIAVDLGDRIGSPRWWRGLATLAAMIATLIHVAPELSPRAITAPAARRSPPAATAHKAAPDLAQAGHPQHSGIDIALTMRAGDALDRRLIAAGAAPDDAVAVARLVAAVVPRLADRTAVAATLGRSAGRPAPRPIELVSLRPSLDLALGVRRVGGRLVLVRDAIAIDETPRRLSGPIGTSLYRAARNAGVPLPVLADYLHAIAAHLDIDEISPGDRFDVVLAHRQAATGESEDGRLLYGALTHDGHRIDLMRWTLEGREQWLDADGAGERREGMTMPVPGPMTSGFGMRYHPILGFTRMHQGVDLAAPYGTPIVAASAGVVQFAGWHGGHGNYVLVAHAGGMATGYGHMSTFVVRPGEAVRQGELLGYVGSTGLSTGPHCHFEVFRDGVAIDPETAEIATTPALAGDELARFKATLARYAALRPSV